jgi:hypothetical protein
VIAQLRRAPPASRWPRPTAAGPPHRRPAQRRRARPRRDRRRRPDRTPTAAGQRLLRAAQTACTTTSAQLLTHPRHLRPRPRRPRTAHARLREGGPARPGRPAPA